MFHILKHEYKVKDSFRLTADNTGLEINMVFLIFLSCPIFKGIGINMLYFILMLCPFYHRFKSKPFGVLVA